MISKGTTHNSGGRLARYLVNGKEGERAELYELRGFASPEIVEAFRSVHVIAEATKCQQPFFHVQVRCPEGEQLTREQWVYTANRIERMMGLGDQPRAIAFHVDEKSGERHMHVAWSRIDDETLTAKPLPFFKERLKKVSRELEVHFDLTLVPNERDSSIKYAPTRAEDQQARRLGVDIHATRQTIRDCYDKSDCGRSFEAALAEDNLLLAKGDRRDFVVIDHAGGMHALGKRILGVSAKEIRHHLGDLNPDHLLTIEQAQERAQSQKGDREKPEPVWDRDADHNKWMDQVAKAAIEKEKVDRYFAEPSRGEQELFEIERQAFRDLNSIGLLTNDLPPEKPPEELKGVELRIWEASERTHNAGDFERALDDEKLAFAVVTKEEADRSHREASFAKAIGRYAPRFGEGEIVVVTEPGLEFRTGQGEIQQPRRVHRIDQISADKHLTKLGISKDQVKGIDATKDALDARAQDRAANWNAIKLERATTINGNAPKGNGLGALLNAAGQLPGQTMGVVGKGAESLANMAGAVMELFGDMFGATEMTEERIRAAIDNQEQASERAERDHALGRAEADHELRVEHRDEQEIEEERQRDYYEEQYDRQR